MKHRSVLIQAGRVVWPLMVLIAGSATVGCAGPTKAPPTTPTAAPPAAPEADAHGQKKSDQPYAIEDWWPNRLDLRSLKASAPAGDPMKGDFDYAAEFAKLDLAAVKKDLAQLMVTSQPWWPADHGSYAGLMIRLAWHSAGTYRVADGRGGAADGTIRFAPLNSWPDNGNLDKARRLLWPIKKKYGRSLSWADLIILSGNVALETAGFKPFGFGGGREDVYEPTDINWGPETEWLASDRFTAGGKLAGRLGATHMGLIYVNPEGPGGKPDPLASAQRIRETFGRMAMNDEETVALIAGGHTLGKAHGAAKPQGNVGVEPEGAPLEQQGLGWKNTHGTGKGGDTITSGLEGAWTNTPDRWSHGFLQNLYKHEWVLTKSPAGAQQWVPKDGAASVPDAHDKTKFHKPIMLTTDLALRVDPAYGKISKRFHDNPAEFQLAFAKAWFKLTHRDMGPHARLVGKEVPPAQLWQDPVPAPPSLKISATDGESLKKEILASGTALPLLVKAAWASASTFRETDMRGGANGARIRLAPQKDWAVNQPSELAQVISVLEGIQKKYNDARPGGRQVSVADLIVLGGAAAVEEAAKQAGVTVKVPFTPGRSDATQEMTDVNSFQNLKPQADGFRNYLGGADSKAATEQLVEKADFLTLTAPEMTVLVAGMRVLGANYDNSKHGVFTASPGTLSNDFFVNLLDMGVEWRKSAGQDAVYEAVDRTTGAVKWTGTAVDIVFGSNSQLRAIAETYASDDAKEKVVQDFVAVWTKVMNLDRFDLVAKK